MGSWPQLSNSSGRRCRPSTHHRLKPCTRRSTAANEENFLFCMATSAGWVGFDAYRAAGAKYGTPSACTAPAQILPWYRTLWLPEWRSLQHTACLEPNTAVLLKFLLTSLFPLAWCIALVLKGCVQGRRHSNQACQQHDRLLNQHCCSICIYSYERTCVHSMPWCDNTFCALRWPQQEQGENLN